MLGPSFSVRTRRQKNDLEWKPKLGTNAPSRAEEVPTRFRRITLRRRRRSRSEAIPDTTILIVVVVLFATLILGWQVLAG